MCIVTLDTGGTNIKTALFRKGRMIDSDIIPAHSGTGMRNRLPSIKKSIYNLLDRNDLKIHNLKGLGWAMPGIIDIEKNRVLSINDKFNDTLSLDFSQWTKDELGVPLCMENDARAALAGEWQYGAGKGSDDLVIFTFGTGVGGAALINGTLLYGKHYQAGCLGGHFTIDFDGPLCNCGNVGCVEAIGASWNIGNLGYLLERNGHESIFRDFASIFEQYRKGNKAAIRQAGLCMKAWAAGVVNAVHAYDPEKVILSGGVMKSGDIILPFLRDYVKRHAWTPWGKVEIVGAGKPDLSGLLGMHYLVSKKLLNA